MNAEQLNRKLKIKYEFQKIMRSDRYCNQTKIFVSDARHLQKRGYWTVVAHGERFRAATQTLLAGKIDRYLKRNKLTCARMF